MSISSKTEAQQRADQIKHFELELQDIEKDKIISLSYEQHNNIKNYHQKLINQLSSAFDIDSTKQNKQLSLGMKIASFLAALGLAFSIFFLFYQFWGSLVINTQVSILVLTPLILLATTLYLYKIESTSYYTKIFALLSFATFVLNLSMLGSIFNIAPTPNALLIWYIFALLLAYASDARLLLGISIIFFSLFLSAKFATWSGIYWIHFGNNPENFLPVALLLFLVSFLPHRRFNDFGVIYRVFAMLIFFIPVLILSNWGAGSYLNISNNIIEGFYQIVGFIFSAIAIYIGITKGLSEVVTSGNVFFTIFLYTKFYDWWWDWMPKYIFFLIVGLSAVLILMLLKRYRAMV